MGIPGPKGGIWVPGARCCAKSHYVRWDGRLPGGAPANQMVPEIVRIGVANARITCVTRQRLEYINEAGQECFVDLDECARNWAEEDEDEFVLLTPEDNAGRRKELHVARRSSHVDPPEWVEFTNNRRTRFEFRSYKEAYHTLLHPLRKAGWYTRITHTIGRIPSEPDRA